MYSRFWGSFPRPVACYFRATEMQRSYATIYAARVSLENIRVALRSIIRLVKFKYFFWQ